MPTESNRWEPFTDAEIVILDEALRFTAVGCDRPEDDLAEDLEREILRRPSLKHRRTSLFDS